MPRTPSLSWLRADERGDREAQLVRIACDEELDRVDGLGQQLPGLARAVRDGCRLAPVQLIQLAVGGHKGDEVRLDVHRRGGRVLFGQRRARVHLCERVAGSG